MNSSEQQQSSDNMMEVDSLLTVNDNDDVFNVYRTRKRVDKQSSFKRPADTSPKVPRKRLSTSSNDLASTEIVENQLPKSMKPPNSLNLSLPEQEHVRRPRPNRLHLHRSVSSRTYRHKAFLNNSSQQQQQPSSITPVMAQMRLGVPSRPGDSSTPLLSPIQRKIMRASTPNRSLRQAAINRSFSVRTPTRPALLRRLNSETSGSISQLHSSQLNRTNSGFFSRRIRSSSTCTVARTPSLKRSNSSRIVSSKVKRCHSAASLMQRRKVL